MSTTIKNYLSYPIMQSIMDTTIITKREHQILKLLAEDYTTKELANMLFLSTETITSHRKNLRAKLDVKTTAGLVWKGVQLGLLETQAAY